jgi:hypothetical protein
MSQIYKVDKKKLKLDIQIDNIYICSPCHKYIKSDKFKNLLRISTNPKLYINNIKCNIYKNPVEYTKCYICTRCISNIINGPDIIKFLDYHLKENNGILNDEILLKIGKVSKWSYNDIYDYFNPDLVKRYSFDRGQYRNINQAIRDMEGIPQTSIINNKANDLLTYLTTEITGNAI